MPPRRSAAIFRLTVAMLAVFGVLLSCLHVAAGHNGAAWTEAKISGHADPLVPADHDHGHSHEGDDIADDQRTSADHAHDHNPADHIHETANTVAAFHLSARPFLKAINGYEPQMLDPGIPYQLERPPRSVAV